MKNIEQKKPSVHKDHRQRLKTKVKEHGLECLAYHEVLELLLTYTIPRRDTNPIAHDLIDYFGSFSNVIDANYFDLLKVKGVGPESALFINVLSSFMDVYNKSKLEKEVSILNNILQCVKFFRSYYPIKSNEFMVMACLSKSKKVVKTFLYKGHDDIEVSFDIKQIVNRISDHGIHSIVLFHTHPNGLAEPSEQDVAATQRIVNACLMNGIDFYDHIILNESEHYSFKKNGLVDKMKAKYLSVFGTL